MSVGGVLVLNKRLCLLGFGGEIRMDHNVFQVGQAHDLEGRRKSLPNVQGKPTLRIRAGVRWRRAGKYRIHMICYTPCSATGTI